MIYKILLVAGFAGGLWFHGYSSGEHDVQVKWDAQVHAQQVLAEITKRKQAEATVHVVTEYVERIKYVQQTGQTIERKVIEYVPSNTCMLPTGFRLLHDAATDGSDPQSSTDAHGEAIDAQEATSTIIENYTACRANAAQLESLQEWVQGVTSVTPTQP